MKDFFLSNNSALIKSAIIIILLFLVRIFIRKAILKIGRLGDITKKRTSLIIKYVNAVTLLLAVAGLSFIWSVNFEDLGLLFSSLFAVLGVAFFAQWSILSNVTAGIILFFSFPFKKGDRIRIHDSDLSSEAIIIDIKAFYVILKTDKGELVTYPNNLILQKGVSLIRKKEDPQASEE